MNNDHEQLSKNLDELRQRMADTHRHVMNLEVSVSNKTSSAEDALEKYIHLLVSLELYPTPPPPLDHANLALELNPAASTPQDLLQGADLRKTVRPILSSIADAKRAERADSENEKIKVEAELDKIIQECENLEEEILELEKRANSVSYQADEMRDVRCLLVVVCFRSLTLVQAAQRDAIIATQDIDNLEHNIAQAKAAAIANGTGVKSRLQNLEFRWAIRICWIAWADIVAEQLSRADWQSCKAERGDYSFYCQEHSWYCDIQRGGVSAFTWASWFCRSGVNRYLHSPIFILRSFVFRRVALALYCWFFVQSIS